MVIVPALPEAFSDSSHLSTEPNIYITLICEFMKFQDVLPQRLHLSLSLCPGPAGLRPSCLCLKENKKALGQVGLGPGPGPEALFLLLLPKTTKHWAWTLGLGLGPGPAGL